MFLNKNKYRKFVSWLKTLLAVTRYISMGCIMRSKLKILFKKALDYLYKKRGYIILSVLAVLILFVAYEYYSRYFNLLRSPRNIKKAILSYGSYSVLAFEGLQILQVIAFFIPGEFIQISGGYIYGSLLGGLLSLAGIAMGSALVYGISHTYGKPLLEKMVSKKHLTSFDKLLKLGSVNYVVFLLYLIPGLPKDVLGYICGVSEISFRDFMIYSTLGRIPGVFISSFFGARIFKGNKVLLIIISIIMTVLFIVGLLKGERIIKKLAKKD